MDPMAGGGLGPGVEERLAKIEAGLGGGGAEGAGGEMKKPKVDVNTEIYHIKKMLAKMLTTLGIQMDATDMLGDPAEDPEVPPEEAAQDPHSAASQQSSIAPISPIEGASPAMGGAMGAPAPPKAASYNSGQAQPVPLRLQQMTSQAQALAAVLRQASQ
jgi:hypothetical protein